MCTKHYSLKKKCYFKNNTIKESDIPMCYEILESFLYQIIISSTIVIILFDFITLKIFTINLYCGSVNGVILTIIIWTNS